MNKQKCLDCSHCMFTASSQHEYESDTNRKFSNAKRECTEHRREFKIAIPKFSELFGSQLFFGVRVYSTKIFIQLPN